MMTDSNIKVLSIDPCQAPAGVMNAEVTLRFMRRRGIARSVIANRNARVVDSFFGASASKKSSCGLFLFRVVFGAALMAFGFLGLSGVAEPIAWCAAGAGAMVFTGSLNRFLGIAASVASVLMLISTGAGLGMILSGVSAACFLLLAIAGPGRYSVDRLLMRSVCRRVSRAERSGIDLDDYRAFSRL